MITTGGDAMSDTKCPFHHTAGGGTSNQDWWPNQLRLEILRQHSSQSNPMDEDFNYADEFKSLDLDAVKKDLRELIMVTTDLFLFAWLGTALGLIERVTAAAVPEPVTSALRPSTVGLTTSTSTRLAGCFGRSSKSMVGKSLGPT